MIASLCTALISRIDTRPTVNLKLIKSVPASDILFPNTSDKADSVIHFRCDPERRAAAYSLATCDL